MAETATTTAPGTQAGAPDPVVVVYNNAIFALSTAQATLNWLASDGATRAGLSPGFSAAAGNAAQELALLSAQLDAYNRGSPQADIDPPDQGTIDQSAALLQQLRDLDLTTAAQADVNAIVTQLLKLVAAM